MKHIKEQLELLEKEQYQCDDAKCPESPAAETLDEELESKEKTRLVDPCAVASGYR